MVLVIAILLLDGAAIDGNDPHHLGIIEIGTRFVESDMPVFPNPDAGDI